MYLFNLNCNFILYVFYFFLDFCKDNGCEYICINFEDGVVCYCKEGYIFNEDKKICNGNCILCGVL